MTEQDAPIGSAAPNFPRAAHELWRRRRHLPHWERAGETYFVTVRFQVGTMADEERRVVLDACLYWHGVKTHVHGAVVMPEHVHILMRPLPVADQPATATPGMEKSYHSLIEIMHSIKSFTAHTINRGRRRRGKVWGQESYDRIMRDSAEFDEKLRYILNNPVKRELVADGWEYPFMWLEEMARERL